MRIIKDVIISGAIEPVWAHMVSHSRLKLGDHSVDGGGQQRVEVFELTPPTRLSYRSVISGFPVVTTIELSRKGKRTGLKVTVTGWEKAGADRARAEMPRVSLEWEKALASLKRNVESPAE